MQNWHLVSKCLFYAYSILLVLSNFVAGSVKPLRLFLLPIQSLSGNLAVFFPYSLFKEIPAMPDVTPQGSVVLNIPQDVWIYRIVVGALGLTILIAMCGTLYLANTEKGVPQALVAIGSAAVGALAGLLAPSPART
jgi:hypothetical protein